MSDDEQGGVPEDQPETAENSEETPESVGGDEAETETGAETETEAGAGTADDAGESPEASADDAAAGSDDGAEADPDATAALAAAQAAVADALGGDLSGASDGEVDAAQAAASTEQDIEAMMAAAMAEEAGGEPSGFPMPSFDPAAPAADSAEMQLLGDVNVDVRIELGRTRMLVEDVLRLGEGAVVELEKLAGDPVDVYVNGRHVAKGEVLVLNESFCVRVNEVLEPVTTASAENG